MHQSGLAKPVAGYLFVGDSTAYHDKIETMSKLVVAPLPDDVFKPDIFKGKVLFCTGGGFEIGRAMTEAVVSNLDLCSHLSAHLDVVQMHHGANATIVGQQ